MHIKTLFVILKIAERCNLACTYCYYYTDAYKDVYARPSLMSEEVMKQAIDFIKQALHVHDIENLVIAFHGGEPTLMKPGAINKLCEDAKATLAPKLRSLRFVVQTNAVHLSENWLDLIERHDLVVGISVDGVAAVHDAHRIDHRGRGTHSRVEKTLSALRSRKADDLDNVGAISVMAEPDNTLQTYLHLTNELGFRRVKFLFMDATHDDFGTRQSGASTPLGGTLCDVFDYWLLHHYPAVDVDLFSQTARRILVAGERNARAKDELTLGMAILSDGTVRISDDFMVAEAWYADQARVSIMEHSFSDWIDQPHVRQIIGATLTVPAECGTCRYQGSCGGGEIPSRYSTDLGFNGKSVNCGDLFQLHAHIERRISEGKMALARMSG